MSTGDQKYTEQVQEAIRNDILASDYEKLQKKYSELESIVEEQALCLISLKRAIEDPGTPQSKRGYPHYLQLVYENLNRYIRFKTKYKPKPKNDIKSETA